MATEGEEMMFGCDLCGITCTDRNCLEMHLQVFTLLFGHASTGALITLNKGNKHEQLCIAAKYCILPSNSASVFVVVVIIVVNLVVIYVVVVTFIIDITLEPFQQLSPKKSAI